MRARRAPAKRFGIAACPGDAPAAEAPLPAVMYFFAAEVA
jgi:hypothetical protein